MKKRIALLGIYHETNTFIDAPTTLDDFKKGYWLEGEAIRQEYEGAHHEISGVIEVIDQATDAALVPVFYAMATPGGIVTDDACEAVLARMMTLLDEVLPVDGCLVVPHGAGVTPARPDMDGHWLGLLRKKLGDHIPITGTLDPHANVSPAMIDATDFLVPYGTNPHVDQRATGRQAAEVMLGTLRGEIQPVQRLVQLPLAISIEQQNTTVDPCKSLYQYARQLQARHQLLSVGTLLGFPYADVAEMGSAFIIAARNDGAEDREVCEKVGQKLAEYVLHHRQEFNGQKTRIESVLDALPDAPKPVLALDMGDNVGGGSPGNSTYLLVYFEEKKMSGVFICLYDPAAVQEAVKYRTGDTFELAVGGKDGKYPTKVVLRAISDGIFQEDTPRHGGFVRYDMGPTAVVETSLGNTVMLTTKRTPPYSLRQMTAFGLQPEDFNIIVAKGVNAPIAAYSAVCPTILQIDTPGVTQADMTLFTYKNRRKPMFPFEEII